MPYTTAQQRYHTPSDETPLCTVVEAISDALGVAIEEIEQLHELLPVTALQHWPTTRSGTNVMELQYRGLSITVGDDGSVVVTT